MKHPAQQHMEIYYLYPLVFFSGKFGLRAAKSRKPDTGCRAGCHPVLRNAFCPAFFLSCICIIFIAFTYAPGLVAGDNIPAASTVIEVRA